MSPEDIAKIASEISAKVSAEVTKTLTDQLDLKLDKQKEEILKAIRRKHQEMDNKILRLEERLDSGDLRNSESDMIAIRKCNVVVNGIPYSKNENVNTIYTTITSNLGYKEPPFAQCFRMTGTEPTRPILIRLDSDMQKEHFMSAYYKVAKALLLDKFEGFAGQKTRVYLGEDLTPTQYSIFKQALIHKKATHIHQMKVQRGLVFIKIKPDSRFISFSSTEELKTATLPSTLEVKEPAKKKN